MRMLPIHREEAAHVNKLMHRPIGAAQNSKISKFTKLF
jgi:hypothetical protein